MPRIFLMFCIDTKTCSIDYQYSKTRTITPCKTKLSWLSQHFKPARCLESHCEIVGDALSLARFVKATVRAMYRIRPDTEKNSIWKQHKPFQCVECDMTAQAKIPLPGFYLVNSFLSHLKLNALAWWKRVDMPWICSEARMKQHSLTVTDVHSSCMATTYDWKTCHTLHRR